MRRTTTPHRTTTHDGQIWTRPRQQMTNATAIRQRMAQEARAEIRRAGEDAVITAADFHRRGWTNEQVSAHLASAIDLATAGTRTGAA